MVGGCRRGSHGGVCRGGSGGSAEGGGALGHDVREWVLLVHVCWILGMVKVGVGEMDGEVEVLKLDGSKAFMGARWFFGEEE